MTAILVIEDDELIRCSLCMLLESEGYQVQEASNGKEGLDALESIEAPPSMILLDLMMPVMDGIEFRRRQLRSKFADVPVAVITGRADTSEIRSLAPVAVIAKPFDFAVIRELVKDHCTVSA